MWQSKREISRECNNIIWSAKGSQISEKYWGEVGKRKRADIIYLEVKKRRGHIFFEWNKYLWFILPLYWKAIVELSVIFLFSKSHPFDWIVAQIQTLMWLISNDLINRCWEENIAYGSLEVPCRVVLLVATSNYLSRIYRIIKQLNTLFFSHSRYILQ